jgi:hypothetical protein
VQSKIALLAPVEVRVTEEEEVPSSGAQSSLPASSGNSTKRLLRSHFKGSGEAKSEGEDDNRYEGQRSGWRLR